MLPTIIKKASSPYILFKTALAIVFNMPMTQTPLRASRKAYGELLSLWDNQSSLSISLEGNQAESKIHSLCLTIPSFICEADPALNVIASIAELQGDKVKREASAQRGNKEPTDLILSQCCLQVACECCSVEVAAIICPEAAKLRCM